MNPLFKCFLVLPVIPEIRLRGLINQIKINLIFFLYKKLRNKELN
jgi:hypothetical protein